MEIVRLDPQTVVIREIDPFIAALLRRIPDEADPAGDQAANERMFSKPTGAGQGGELNEEWKQYVEPELRHLFQSATETVSGDLKAIRKVTVADGAPEWYEMEVPVGHLEQWLNALNQARLVMAARNGFTDKELAEDYPAAINSTRDMNLFQIHFYGLLQEFFIREVE